MNISELTQSKYLKRADVGNGVLLTIDHLAQEDLSQEGEPEQHGWIIYFKECQKGLVLKPTNAQLISLALGSEETDLWIGKQIVLFDDPTIMFKGQRKGGIRARASKRAQPAPAPVQRQPAPAMPTAPRVIQQAAAPLPVDDGVAQDDVPF